MQCDGTDPSAGFCIIYPQSGHCSDDGQDGLQNVSIYDSFELHTFFFRITILMDNPVGIRKEHMPGEMAIRRMPGEAMPETMPGENHKEFK